ncbi:hypothetical protein CcaCcLH18_10928 [Colletotrichum camelliae]|nr:hypothetical protein CcaCcLH18_10928 [Colletotrichum camelliae]
MSGTGTVEEPTRLSRLLKEAQELAAREKQRADDAEQQSQPTSLDEYIAACHSLVYTKFTVETDRKLTSKGSITNPRDKWCLTNLQPLGSRIARRKITNKKALKYFMHNSVEDPVQAIMDELKEVEEVRSVFGLGNGIVFDNHPHALSDTSGEVVNRNAPATPPSISYNSKVNLKQLQADQICVYRSENTSLTGPVAQYLAFSLIALGMPGERLLHGQDERREAMDKLKTWAEDFETTLRSVPDDERQPLQSSPGYKPKAYKDVNRSPHLRRRRRRGHARDVHTREQGRKEWDESSDDESRRDVSDTPTPSERRTRGMDTQSQGTRRSQRIAMHRSRGGGGGGNNNDYMPYCTQKCLLGLVRGGALDQECPNELLHRNRPNHARRHNRSNGRADARHPINQRQGGMRGVLFKISLLAFSYTFVGKGTVQAFIKDLKRKAAIYKHLQPIQDARDCYLKEMAIRSLRAIHGQGVAHRDIQKENMLFNEGVNGVMLVDFERAQVLTPPRRPLTQLVPNKRRRTSEVVKGRELETTAMNIPGLMYTLRSTILIGAGVGNTASVCVCLSPESAKPVLWEVCNETYLAGLKMQMCGNELWSWAMFRYNSSGKV